MGMNYVDCSMHKVSFRKKGFPETVRLNSVFKFMCQIHKSYVCLKSAKVLHDNKEKEDRS